MIRLELNNEERMELNYIISNAVTTELEKYTVAVTIGAEYEASQRYKTAELLKEIQYRMYDLGNEVVEITNTGAELLRAKGGVGA